MLTPEEKNEIEKLLADGWSIFKVATKTEHSHHTVRKVRDELLQKVAESDKTTSTNQTQDFTLIPLEVGFLVDLVIDKVVDPSSEVLVPVTKETAYKYYQIDKTFQGLASLFEGIGEKIHNAMENDRSEE